MHLAALPIPIFFGKDRPSQTSRLLNDEPKHISSRVCLFGLAALEWRKKILYEWYAKYLWPFLVNAMLLFLPLSVSLILYKSDLGISWKFLYLLPNLQLQQQDFFFGLTRGNIWVIGPRNSSHCGHADKEKGFRWHCILNTGCHVLWGLLLEFYHAQLSQVFVNTSNIISCS